MCDILLTIRKLYRCLKLSYIIRVFREDVPSYIKICQAFYKNIQAFEVYKLFLKLLKSLDGFLNFWNTVFKLIILV